MTNRATLRVRKTKVRLKWFISLQNPKLESLFNSLIIRCERMNWEAVKNWVERGWMQRLPLPDPPLLPSSCCCCFLSAPLVFEVNRSHSFDAVKCTQRLHRRQASSYLCCLFCIYRVMASMSGKFFSPNYRMTNCPRQDTGRERERDKHSEFGGGSCLHVGESS